MAAFVRQAAKDGRPIDEVERGLWQSLLALGHTLLASYVEGVGPGNVGDTLAYEGQELRRLESPHDRRYVSVFGELTISRYVYGTRETQKHEVVPTDALLGLPESDFSSVLQEWDQSFRVQDSYEESRRTVERVLGIGQSVRSLEQMSLAMAEGAVRHLVKDRMERTGMRWRVPGAQAMLDLRAVYINGDWDAFQHYRIEEERRRPYPYRPLVRRKLRKVA